MKRQIPNIITLCNLLSGVMATVAATSGRLDYAALWIVIGIAFDFCDGLAARLLHVASPLGKELDSLADVVTSGVAPSLIFYYILRQQGFGAWSYLALLIAAFAAYRLAKFNLDTRQSHSFLGLPVPSNALIWAALGAVYSNPALTSLSLIDTTGLANIMLTTDGGLIALIVIEMIGCWLMISEVPLMALKLKSLGWQENRVRYILLIGAVALIAVFGVMGIAFSIVWYIVLSLIAPPVEE